LEGSGKDANIGVLPPQEHSGDGPDWGRHRPGPQAAATGADGHLPLSELAFERAAAPSPFGEDVTFPLPVEQLNYHHGKRPKDDVEAVSEVMKDEPGEG
jgi:hypothetical protein